jgi:glyoxylase-like metal-dependent hydrolase (beta-lactamase superfamily II)
MKCGRVVTVLLGIALSSSAQQAPPAVRTVKLADNLFELTTFSSPIGTKMLALVGPEGALLVDTGEAETAEAEREELSRLSAGSVRYVINTHLHDDHTGGNPVLGIGATVIAHDNVRRRYTTGARLLFPRPKEALPSLTFDHAMTLYVNGEEVRLLHMPPGHTDGDIIVHFVRSATVAVGDLIFADKFPFVALPHGGNVQGYLDDLETMASTFPEETRFVAAHGPIYTAVQVRAYRAELLAMRDRVRQGLATGKTTAQLKAAKVLDPWASWGDSYITADRFIDTLVAAETPSPDAGKPSVADQMAPALMGRADGETAARLYRRLKAEQPFSYRFDEDEINLLGYGLLSRKRVADAIAIFRLNVEEHPASANVYDSLAEAYMADGQKESAITNYRKSLELDPSNSNAARMLERLQKE